MKIETAYTLGLFAGVFVGIFGANYKFFGIPLAYFLGLVCSFGGWFIWGLFK